jgi:hypothetical protein
MRRSAELMDLLLNLAILAVIGIVLFALFPDIMRQVLGLYDGLGILPVMVILVILAALPKRKRRKRNQLAMQESARR